MKPRILDALPARTGIEGLEAEPRAKDLRVEVVDRTRAAEEETVRILASERVVDPPFRARLDLRVGLAECEPEPAVDREGADQEQHRRDPMDAFHFGVPAQNWK